jgi:hypothetical protein
MVIEALLCYDEVEFILTEYQNTKIAKKVGLDDLSLGNS